MKMKFSIGKRKSPETSVALCEGLLLDEEIYEKKENRIWPLFLKGILAYLVCAGTIGSVLTAAGTPYNAFFLHLFIFTAAVGFSCMYYRKWTAHIGALLFLFIVLFFAFRMNRFINSGFYAVINDLSDHASDYFNLNGVKVFTEQINNRRVATTISMSFIGSVASVVLDIFLMYRMRYLWAAFLSLPFLLFPVYIGREPSLLYVGMLLVGLLAAFAWKRAGHFQKVDSDSAYMVDKKNNLHCIYHKKSLFCFMGQIFLTVMILLIVIVMLNPKKEYLAKQKISKLKLQTEDVVENYVRLGIFGFVNRYENIGGMNSGRLGGISSVNISYQPLLKLHITPYSYDTVYLKANTFGEYVPYDNMWIQAAGRQRDIEEAIHLRKAFHNGVETSAEGKAKVEDIANISGGPNLPYPYYSVEGHIVDDNQDINEFVYYPRLATNMTLVEQEIDLDYWLQIPDVNYDTIAKFCEEAGFGGRNEEIVEQVKSYFQREIPYTLRPGATPRKSDFINYFLEESRKGYCSYFASAATLIFRYYGIPARYVEGFAASYDEILNGTLVEGARYEEYYKGYSELGETALVEVVLTDADAHAWVEVYDENYGWVPIEVTPYSTSSEQQRVNFWSMFLNFLSAEEGNTDETSKEENDTVTGFDFSVNKAVVRTLLIFVAVMVVLLYMIRQLFWWMRYYKADRNDRLIFRYQRYLHKKEKKYKLLSEKKNYREQILYLTEGEALEEIEKEQIIAVLEKAGFSDHEITPEEEQSLYWFFDAK